MPQDKVKLPRSSYEELCKIIRAYGRLEKPGNLDAVNALAGVGKTVVSANNSFLAFIGVIEGGNSKSPTPLGKRLANALEHEILVEMQSAWKEVVENNEFLRKMALALKIRKIMEESAFVSHIAYSAGESKSAFVKTGARTVIDILRAAGFVQESDGKLTSTELLVKADESLVGKQPNQGVAPIQTPKLDFFINADQRVGGTLHIQVRIDVKPSDLDDLAARLKKFLKDLEMTQHDESNAKA